MESWATTDKKGGFYIWDIETHKVKSSIFLNNNQLDMANKQKNQTIGRKKSPLSKIKGRGKKKSK